MVMGSVMGRIITFGRNKRAVHILHKRRRVCSSLQVLWCILVLAHFCTLDGVHFDTSDEALDDILVWEFSGPFDGEFVCIPAWEHFGSSVWVPCDILVYNEEKKIGFNYEIIVLGSIQNHNF